MRNITVELLEGITAKDSKGNAKITHQKIRDVQVSYIQNSNFFRMEEKEAYGFKPTAIPFHFYTFEKIEEAKYIRYEGQTYFIRAVVKTRSIYKVIMELVHNV